MAPLRNNEGNIVLDVGSGLTISDNVLKTNLNSDQEFQNISHQYTQLNTRVSNLESRGSNIKSFTLTNSSSSSLGGYISFGRDYENSRMHFWVWQAWTPTKIFSSLKEWEERTIQIQPVPPFSSKTGQAYSHGNFLWSIFFDHDIGSLVIQGANTYSASSDTLETPNNMYLNCYYI